MGLKLQKQGRASESESESESESDGTSEERYNLQFSILTAGKQKKMMRLEFLGSEPTIKVREAKVRTRTYLQGVMVDPFLPLRKMREFQ